MSCFFREIGFPECVSVSPPAHRIATFVYKRSLTFYPLRELICDFAKCNAIAIDAHLLLKSSYSLNESSMSQQPGRLILIFSRLLCDDRKTPRKPVSYCACWYGEAMCDGKHTHDSTPNRCIPRHKWVETLTTHSSHNLIPPSVPCHTPHKRPFIVCRITKSPL
jgi:hypothetical protein